MGRHAVRRADVPRLPLLRPRFHDGRFRGGASQLRLQYGTRRALLGGAYSYGWLEALETYHRKWAGRLPLGVEPLDGTRLADLDRRAEAYFLKLLCQKRLFGACPFRRIVRYIRTYPGRAASWALPFKYLKYHLKSLVRHG